ncbi:MAG: PrsW family glutamic-type intramembrane protease [Thermaerobacter sp.]|nr:PrsW family glutamic-type intramembrane protease [Thermaerobacter sp.]
MSSQLPPRVCDECGQPLDQVRCPDCQQWQGGGLFAVANRRLPKNLVFYLTTIAASRLYLGLLLFAIAPMLLLGFHVNVVVGMMAYFSLFWFFVFQPLLATHLQLRPLFADIGAYLFTGVVGTAFALAVEGFWFRHGGSVLLKSPALVVAVPAYVLFVGVTEEFAKQIVVLIVLFYQRVRGHAWNPLTYMMLGVSSGLGFSAVENITYVERGISFEVMRHTFGLGTITALTRALYTPFLHAIWAGLTAYGFGVVASRGFRDWRIGLGALGAAALFHGVYDASVGIDPGLAVADVAVSYLVFLAMLLNDRRGPVRRS